jgi:DNA polymerase V
MLALMVDWIFSYIHASIGIILSIFASDMDSKFVPHKVDCEEAFESALLGEVKAGFPSPAEDIREKLDLVKLLVRHKASTFFFRVSGVSMVDAAMDEGDIIIVDRAIDPYNNCKAVCFIDGEYTVKRVEMLDGRVRLMPANENNSSYKPIEVTAENNFIIWGVVTYTIKKM